MADEVRLDREGPVLIVTMNRPEVRNALNNAMLAGLANAWDLLEADDELRVGVLTGAGGAFCAGGDLTTMAITSESEHYATDRSSDWNPMLRNRWLSKPLVAAVEGPAIAGGTEILTATDVRVAGEGARFGLPEVTLGLVPMAGSTVRLRRQISYTKAMEMMLTGELIDAQEARSCGLIGRVVPDGQALDHATSIAQRIARQPRKAVSTIKQTVRATECLPEEEAMQVDLGISLPIFDTPDAREGVRAFIERRQPRYT